jgi:hypothetical protein
MKRWPLRLVILAAVGFVSSCGSSSGNPDAGLEGGPDGKTPPKKDAEPHDGPPHDGTPQDSNPVDGRPADSNPGDGPIADVTPADAPSKDAGHDCHMIDGEASTLSCLSPSGPTAPTICLETGYEPGPCPSAGLTGCCTYSSGNTICTYASDGVSAAMQKATCMSTGGMWSTTPP